MKYLKRALFIMCLVPLAIAIAKSDHNPSEAILSMITFLICIVLLTLILNKMSKMERKASRAMFVTRLDGMQQGILQLRMEAIEDHHSKEELKEIENQIELLETNISALREIMT